MLDFAQCDERMRTRARGNCQLCCATSGA